MNNIAKEKPTDPLHGRALYSKSFILDNDIKGKKILDIGCGYGWFEIICLKIGCKKIVGLEPTNADLETAKKYFKTNKVALKLGNAVSLPFNGSLFDTVVSWEVIEHIPKKSENKMFQEIRRVLKPKGVFYLSTPNRSFLGNVFDPAWWLIGHRHYSLRALKDYSKKNGFKVEKVAIAGSLWELIWVNDLYISKWVFKRKPFFKNFIEKKQDEEYANQNGFTNIFLKLRKIG